VIVIKVKNVSAAEDAALSLSNALTSESGLSFDVQVAESYSEAHRALCGRTAVAVTVDAFSYMGIHEEGCGSAEMILESEGQTASQGQFIANDVFRPELYAGVFCRPDSESLGGWIMPTLTLRARGVDSFTDFYGIIDAGSDEEVVHKVHDGECSLGATTFGAELEVSGLEHPERVHVLEALEPVPYEVVAVSDLVDASIRARVLEVLSSHAAELASILGGDALQPVSDAAFDGLRALFSDAGVDPAAMGQ
jgi:phosphonate transport system substrate-binding protein